MTLPPAPSSPSDHVDVGCPFCGLLCDDLSVRVMNGVGQVTAKGCERSKIQFALPLSLDGQCLVDGVPASVDVAIARAVEILRLARQPLMLSAGAEVGAMRALVALAERCGAIVDHVNEGLMRNMLALQDSGWITTTLTEIRNRADLLLCVGTDVVSRAPRFFERFAVGGSMFGEDRPAPEILFMSATPPANLEAQHLPMEQGQLAASFRILKALAIGKTPQGATSALVELAQRATHASYGVVVWAAADFNFAHAELTVQSICEWIKVMNRRTRLVGLPLGGSAGDITAHQVMTWQTGVSLRTRFAAAGPNYDPHRHASRRVLQDEGTDALLCVAEWDDEWNPPPGNRPSIVIGRGRRQAPDCTVYIPVGVPGIHRRGHAFRTDNVVAVPLRKLTSNTLHSAPKILDKIRRGLT